MESDKKKSTTKANDSDIAPPQINPYFLSFKDQDDVIPFAVDYWKAQTFATRLHNEFEISLQKGNLAGMQSRFYALVDYYERSMRLLRQALVLKNAPLIVSALRSLIALNTPLHDMYRVAPNAIPLPLTIDPKLRKQIVNDLIIQFLQESGESPSTTSIMDYLNEHRFMQEIRPSAVRKHLKDLVANGHISFEHKSYSRTKRPYKSTNFDDASLLAFLGPDLYAEFERSGFPGISNIVNRNRTFQQFFEKLTGTGNVISELFTATLVELIGSESQRPKLSSWQHKDLVNSIIPRPYQRDAFTIFRGHGYQGQLIEAPTGSGKTLIGMMCIQDWLSAMSLGETILVLVPTINYEQQWVRELCYKSIGLQLSPDEVFAGTPRAYEIERRKAGSSPPILVMTYTALAQLGSPKGKGGFDQISLEKFLQSNNIRYVILDEVHKVAEKIQSVSASVTRLLIEWLEDGSLEGLIGFSGTAEAFRNRFEELGLKLVYNMPSADLIAYGFVAPFAEFGMPFAHSDREQRVLNLLDNYKSQLRVFIDILGSDKLRKLFSNIPMKIRVEIGRDVLGMYAGRKDRNKALRERFREWQKGNRIMLNELNLITIIQIAENLSDEPLLWKALAELPIEEKKIRMNLFEKIQGTLDGIRTEIKKLIFYSDIVPKLNIEGFGSIFDADALKNLPSKDQTKYAHRAEVRNLLATSFVGLFSSLKSIYYRIGEGMVESISAVIKAERTARTLTGVIVFGHGKRIEWESGLAIPGFAGVAGIFSQMLGQRGLTPMAVLSSEIYLPWNQSNPIPHQISKFIKNEIMINELGNIFCSLITQGLDIESDKFEKLRIKFNGILKDYVTNLKDIGAPRPITFNRNVLDEMRRVVKKFGFETEQKLIRRLDIKSSHMKKWLSNFFDYALISSRFMKATTATLQQADGKEQKFFVIKMDSGERKQLMYDLAARIMDADRLPVNTIIVSNWARTGWNVIKPNLLIDATATRNVTAWQQLRGRTMRAMSTWDKTCYETMMLLLGPIIGDSNETDEGTDSEDSSTSLIVENKLDKTAMNLLLNIHEEAKEYFIELDEIPHYGKDLTRLIQKKDLTRLSGTDRIQLAIEMMMFRNKVTHIYEMVKAFGNSTQIRYNRRTRLWQRKQAIAAKHSHSYSVSPISGVYSKGEDHAPLVYIDDPRQHSPSKLSFHLVKILRNCDSIIVEGWIKAVVSG